MAYESAYTRTSSDYATRPRVKLTLTYADAQDVLEDGLRAEHSIEPLYPSILENTAESLLDLLIDAAEEIDPTEVKAGAKPNLNLDLPYAQAHELILTKLQQEDEEDEDLPIKTERFEDLGHELVEVLIEGEVRDREDGHVHPDIFVPVEDEDTQDSER